MPRYPRRLGLKRSEGKCIVRLLSAVPKVAPEVEVEITSTETARFVRRPMRECSLRPIVGARGLYADYDAVAGDLMEATLVSNRRRTRVDGIIYVDQYDTGGAWNGDYFSLCWVNWRLYRESASSVFVLDPWTGSVERRSKMLPPDCRVSWTGDYRCSGPGSGGDMQAGGAFVSLDGVHIACSRIISVRLELAESLKDLVPAGTLDDTYVRDDGRIVLTRRYVSEGLYPSLEATHDWDDWSVDRGKIAYNGIEFCHWFDILTDVALGLELH